MTHIILLYQFNDSVKSRKWFEFNSLQEACDSICSVYENELKLKFPNKATLSYSASDITKYIDGLIDLGVLVYDSKTFKYDPKNKQWMKEKVVDCLRRRAGAQ